MSHASLDHTARRLLPLLTPGPHGLRRLTDTLCTIAAAHHRRGHRQGLREALMLGAELRLGPLSPEDQRRIMSGDTEPLRIALGQLLRGRADPLAPLPPAPAGRRPPPGPSPPEG